MIEGNWPKRSEATRLTSLLDQWSIREKERNALVHGRFSIRSGIESEWLLINETLTLKKGMAIPDRSMWDARQADAFLKAVISERKQLDDAINAVVAVLTSSP